MSDGTLYSYERREAFKIESLACDLAAIGAAIEHPVEASIMIVSQDGCSYPQPLETLKARLLAGQDVGVQFWFAESHDLYCRVRFLGTWAVVLEFGLDGLEETEADALHACLLNRCIRRGPSNASVGLVFDRQGSSEDCDWDELFHGEAVDLCLDASTLPELIAVRKSRFSDLEWTSPLPELIDADGFIILGRVPPGFKTVDVLP